MEPDKKSLTKVKDVIFTDPHEWGIQTIYSVIIIENEKKSFFLPESFINNCVCFVGDNGFYSQ
jgi:hypothetical protein